MSVNMKRVTTSLIGFPIVAALLILGNRYILDIAFSAIAIIALFEFNKCVKINFKPIYVLEVILAIGISFIHVVGIDVLKNISFFSIPILFLIFFLYVICTNMKVNFNNIAISLVGVLYIVGFISFLALTYGIEQNGKILFWYVLISAWGTDIFAYIFGKKIGKHNFSKVSPKKTVEGCVGGLLGAVVLNVLFTIIINYAFSMQIGMLKIILIGAFLSIIGQIGDFSASAIKRNFDVKDFSNLFPGHGGMLDRIDSVMFIAPFAYFIFTYLI